MASVIAAIDVGTNAARLELVRAHPDAVLETFHYERAPIRPGEGVFESGVMSSAVADRLVDTLQRFATRCRRHDARIRAVATSALRNARNAEAVLRRVHEQAGIQLEIISGREEARLICLGVCRRRPRNERALVLDIGGGSTEVAFAQGGRPTALWSIPVGAVRLTEMFNPGGGARRKKVALMRTHVHQALTEALGETVPAAPDAAFGCSGTIRAVTRFACGSGAPLATAEELATALEQLVSMDRAELLERFSERRADIIVAGAVILEALTAALGVHAVHAVDRGLRNGILLDLQERAQVLPRERLLADEVIRIGRKFGFEEAHARHVTRLSLELFDKLAPIHGLSPALRSLLEVAAWLHDIGKVVSFHRHQRHAHYLIQNVEIVGLVDHERTLAACVARFHRRSPPDKGHPVLRDLSPDDIRSVRRLATILRLADALDRSHEQRVESIEVAITGKDVQIVAHSAQDLELELWDGLREAQLFEEVFECSLVLRPAGVPV